MPFEVRTDFVKVTDDTVLVPVTVQVKNKDITFVSKDGIQRGTVNIFGRVTGITGKVAQTFEDTVQVDVPAELLEKTQEHSSLYWKAVPLRPGRYRLDIVVKDVNGDRVGTWSQRLMVPEYTEDKLASSSLILADHMEKVPAKNVGAGQFRDRRDQVRLSPPGTGGRQAGQLQARPAHEPVDAGLQSAVRREDQEAFRQNRVRNRKRRQQSASAALLGIHRDHGQHGRPDDVGEELALNSFQPGMYRLTVKVDDNVSKQQIAPSVRFAVE